MKGTYLPDLIEQAQKVTFFCKKDILASTVCTCFYCGYQCDPHKKDDFE
ncbi:MAG: hypothetical protein JXK93_01380 [Sphaerochaetaceae bacterium]|nr:hypothetical protein [Sphaerochaetaceae bacterium]